MGLFSIVAKVVLFLFVYEAGLSVYLPPAVIYFLTIVVEELVTSVMASCSPPLESAPLVVPDLEAYVQAPRPTESTPRVSRASKRRAERQRLAAIRRDALISADAFLRQHTPVIRSRTNLESRPAFPTQPAQLVPDANTALPDAAEATVAHPFVVAAKADSQDSPPPTRRGLKEACSAPRNSNSVITIKVDPNEQPVETATAQCDSSEVVTSATSEAWNAAAIANKKRRKVHVRALKMIWSHFDLPDAYMFNRKPFSMRKMTHVIALSTDLGDNVFAQRLDLDSKAHVIKALAKLPSLADKPIPTFTAPELLVSCSNQRDLAVLFKTIEDTGMLGPYHAKIKTKGLPFAPAFWLIRGLSTDLSKNKLRADIQGYIVRNEATLGKWRVVYASWQTKPPVHVAIFTGDVVIVTDAETIARADRHAAPVFHGCVPQRIHSLQNMSNFSAN